MMMELKRKQEEYGVLLVNLGTPDAPTPSAVRRYLKQFLSDRRVVDVPKLIWWPVLNGIILPLRSARVAKAYQSIWQDDSPLRAIGVKQVAELQQYLTANHGFMGKVELAMTYGKPALDDALGRLLQQSCRRIVVLPLYPQYSATTTASVFDALARALGVIRHLPEVRMVQDYHQHPLYIAALAESVQSFWKTHGKPQQLLLSFHGIPQRYARLGDPYPTQCEGTALALVQALGLKEGEWQLTYQSRFGREPWLQPYTDHTLAALAQQGIRSVDVICPAFAADCLETLEEIAEENKEIFLEAGGQQYRYIPALNDSPLHVKMMAALVLEQLTAW